MHEHIILSIFRSVILLFYIRRLQKLEKQIRSLSFFFFPSQTSAKLLSLIRHSHFVRPVESCVWWINGTASSRYQTNVALPNPQHQTANWKCTLARLSTKGTLGVWFHSSFFLSCYQTAEIRQQWQNMCLILACQMYTIEDSGHKGRDGRTGAGAFVYL